MKRYESYRPSNISWIGQIPSHWDERKIQYCFSERTQKGFPNEPMLCATQSQGVIPQSMYANRVVVVNKDFDKQKLVKAGDFVISLRSFEGGLEYAYYQGIISAAYTILTPREVENSEYFKLLFKSYNFIQLLQTCVTGIREGQNINYPYLSKHLIPVPPIGEQERIVEFLSSKTLLIDAQQRERERELRLLDELKQAEIANVVTHGLNPNSPMKSAKTLLGEDVPYTWTLIRMRNLVKPQTEVVGDRTTFPLLSLTKNGVILRDIENGKGKFPKDFQNYKVVVPNDIIFCLFDIDETPRTVGLSSYNGMITGAYDVFAINENLVDKTFLYYYFLAVDNNKALRPYYTGLRKVVQGQIFLGLQIPIPPLEEQKAIVEYIEQKNAAIDEMIANLRAEIEFLTEYKQRLIADVVTGQINVQDI